VEGISLHYVIIGNGGAGISALQAIRSVDNKSKITIISKEKYPAYSPCSLPNLIGGKIEKPKIIRFDKQFYNRLNVKFLKNTKISKISTDKKEIVDTNGNSIKFDKLLIATGAKPITPKVINGLYIHGVHVMGTLDSALEIIDHIKKGVKKAVVVGGGFMGIETATMLKLNNIDVSIVEMLPHILSRMIDPDISEKVEDILKNYGIELLLNNTLKSVNGKKTVESVSLEKKKVPCDMVVLAIGVSPNIEIVNETGIKINKGIIVNSKMQTNKKDIYAAGDITEVIEQIEGKKGSFAIWPNAIEQGRIAGLNMAGKNIEYTGAEVVNVLDVFNIPIIAMGRTSNEIGKCKIISRFTPQNSKKIIIKNNKIIGLQFIGTIRNTGTFYSLMKSGSDVSKIIDRLLDDNFIINPKVVSTKMIV
jgi:NADPH-dependent 2,4-dienoyl-CoA reductase/sulfur reductase-like enzyme